MYKFIVVDDEIFAAKQLSKLLDYGEYKMEAVGVFDTAEEAVSYIENNDVDLVISDIKMPGMTGIDIARICTEKYPMVTVALVSAYRDFEYAREAMQYGVTEYITKPINFGEFEKVIQRLKTKLDNKKMLMSTDANVYSETREPSYAFEDMHKKVIDSAIAFMNENYAQDITLEKVAAHVALSPIYFSNYFKKRTGENFIDYLTKIRIKKAVNMIAEDINIKVEVLCESVGYKSLPYFYKVFKKYTGCLPAEYKSNIIKNGKPL